MRKVYVNKESGNGTHLQGTISTTLSHLRSILGEPEYECEFGYPMDKTTTEWTLEFPDDTIATIYDWKLQFQPSPDELYDWHIGGKSKVAVSRVTELIKGEKDYEVENTKQD